MNPTVYIAFYWGTSWLSKIVEWFTERGPSHVAYVYKDPQWGWVQLGSELGGWIFLPTDGSDIWKLYPVPQGVDIWKGLKANRKWLGARYDFEGLVGMSWVMFWWNVFKKKVKNPIQTASAWFCSEIAAQVFKDGGGNLNLTCGETDPKRFQGEVASTGVSELDPKAVFAEAA